MRIFRSAVLLASSILLVMSGAAIAHPGSGSGQSDADEAHEQKIRDFQAAAASTALDQPLGPAACVDGEAAGFPCDNVNLLSFLPLEAIGGGVIGNDIWGWEDTETGHLYAIMGRTNGTAFVDVTNPEDPVYVGNLPSESMSQGFIFWRDIKVHADHAFIVSEQGGHGMQVFDLTRLRGVATEEAPATFTADTVYRRFSGAHNIFINEDSDRAYVVGSDTCRGGPHVIDVSAPTQPTFLGCFADDGYTHDIQCVVYDGPDTDFTGHEVCFASNEDTVTIADLSDLAAPEILSRVGYPTASYTHQGWLTEEQDWFLFNDELDELFEAVEMQTTYILDVSDLENVPPPDLSTNSTGAIDHNLYITDGLVYESNYTAGLQIFDAASIPDGQLEELARFDVFPEHDDPEFVGTWSNYPFFDEDFVVVSGIDSGLFVLEPTLP